MADLEISPEAWRLHAKHVESVADGLEAASEASDAALSDNAFGLLCTPLLGPVYDLFKLQFVEGASRLKEQFGEDVDALNRTAKDFEEVDAEAALHAKTTYQSITISN